MANSDSKTRIPGMTAREIAQREEQMGRIEGSIREISDRLGIKSQYQSMPQSSLGTGVPAYKRGGMVTRTGLAKVHKGERVLTAKQARTYAKPVGPKGKK